MVTTLPDDTSHADQRILMIGTLSVCNTDMCSALEMIKADIETPKSHKVFGFANVNLVNICRNDRIADEACGSVTLFNDGVGLDIAARLLHGTRFIQNLNGTDFTPKLLGALPEGSRIYLLGSPPGVAETAIGRMARQFPHIRWVGSRHGFFTESDTELIVSEIVASRCDLLIVGMGNPKQEIWAEQHRSDLNVTILCVGAYIDFAADRFRRAPRAIRRLRLEWLFRLILEPRRLARRYLLGNFVFLFMIARQRLGR